MHLDGANECIERPAFIFEYIRRHVSRQRQRGVHGGMAAGSHHEVEKKPKKKAKKNKKNKKKTATEGFNFDDFFSDEPLF